MKLVASEKKEEQLRMREKAGELLAVPYNKSYNTVFFKYAFYS